MTASPQIARQARKQHYVFAHLGFRAIVEASPMHVMLTMLSKDAGTELLRKVWDEVGGQCRDGERVDYGEMRYEVHKLGKDRAIILIAMPAPRGVHEAHFVAAVITPPKRRFFLWEQPAALRYFTLEVGDAEQGEFDTLLGEWRGESHLNYGDSPAVDKDAFLRAIGRVLKCEISPQGVGKHLSRIEG
jgi:hypothetical protein